MMIVTLVSIIDSNDHRQCTVDSNSQSRKIMIEIAILMIVDSVYEMVMSGGGRGLIISESDIYIYIYIIDKNINPII
jgi:hypothetical protein